MQRISDVAERLKISERTVETLIRKGIFPAYRIGRLVFLDFDEVVKAIKTHGTNRDASSGDLEDVDGTD